MGFCWFTVAITCLLLLLVVICCWLVCLASLRVVSPFITACGVYVVGCR